MLVKSDASSHIILFNHEEQDETLFSAKHSSLKKEGNYILDLGSLKETIEVTESDSLKTNKVSSKQLPASHKTPILIGLSSESAKTDNFSKDLSCSNSKTMTNKFNCSIDSS